MVSEKRAKRIQLLQAVEHLLERHDLEDECLEEDVLHRLEALRRALVDWLEEESTTADDHFVQTLGEFSAFLHSRHAMAEQDALKPH